MHQVEHVNYFSKNFDTSRDFFFRALLAIIAIAGKEWTQWEDDAGTLKVTSGLWETCIEKEGVRKNCTTIIVSHLTKGNVKG